MSSLDTWFKALVIFCLGLLGLNAGKAQHDTKLHSDLFVRAQILTEKNMKNHAEWIANLLEIWNEVGKTKTGKLILDEKKVNDEMKKRDNDEKKAMASRIKELEDQLAGKPAPAPTPKPSTNPGFMPVK